MNVMHLFVVIMQLCNKLVNIFLKYFICADAKIWYYYETLVDKKNTSDNNNSQP